MIVVNSEYTILIVGKSRNSLLMLEDELLDQGFNILKAHRGDEALEIIKNDQPDLVISGVEIPDMSGIDMCKHIRSKSTTQKIPVIFLSSVSDTQSIIQAFAVGADDYIVKPYITEVLAARIKHQLSMLVAKRVIVKKNLEFRNAVLARDKMYSVIAHDLRSPIATIKMITNLLSENSKTKAMDDQSLYKMIQDTNYIAEDVYTLLDNLLKWTKSQTGTMTPLFQEIDLVDISKGAVEIFKKIAEVKNIEVQFRSVSTAKVNIDIEMVKSCIRNLMSNAYKFSYNDSKIIVSIEEVEDYFKIGVQDFGCGMDAESAGKLLHVGTHFSTNGTGHEQGSGLGLMLVKELIEKNEGKLWFETVLGVGSTFFISLPRKHEDVKKIVREESLIS